MLNSSINVKGSDEEPANESTFKNIRRIQAVLPTTIPDRSKYYDQEVTVSGSLFQAFSGHHYTEILILIENIDLVITSKK